MGNCSPWVVPGGLPFGEPRLVGKCSPRVVPNGLSDPPCLNLRAIAARCVKSQGDLAGKKVPASGNWSLTVGSLPATP